MRVAQLADYDIERIGGLLSLGTYPSGVEKGNYLVGRGIPCLSLQRSKTIGRLLQVLAILAIVSPALLKAAAPDLSTLKTFGTMGKEVTPLRAEKEAELFRHEGHGCLTHMWFGGAFKGVAETRIRVYVDGEAKASIDMELYLGHGIGFGDDFAPWGIARIGKVGAPNSVYNTYRIPFGKSVRITGELGPNTPGRPDFWWIIRGTENLPVDLGGVRLPDSARLRLYKLENRVVPPLEEFAMCDVPGSGALYQVTMAAKGLRKRRMRKSNGKTSATWKHACELTSAAPSNRSCFRRDWRTISSAPTISTKAATRLRWQD